MATVDVFEHKLASTPVTVYMPLAEALNAVLFVITCGPLHVYPVAVPLPASNKDSPSHKVSFGNTVPTITAGNACTVIKIESDRLQIPLVPVTVYIEEDSGTNTC